jgi:hypothetical protein
LIEVEKMGFEFARSQSNFLLNGRERRLRSKLRQRSLVVAEIRIALWGRLWVEIYATYKPLILMLNYAFSADSLSANPSL